MTPMLELKAICSIMSLNKHKYLVCLPCYPPAEEMQQNCTKCHTCCRMTEIRLHLMKGAAFHHYVVTVFSLGQSDTENTSG